MGLFALIPTALLLSLSFFILFAIRRSGDLKVFGYIVAVLLWISATLFLSSGIYTMATGKCPMMKMKMHKMMMMHKMHGQTGEGPIEGHHMQH